MTALPYYFVCRLHTGRWGVVHRVAGADVDHVDADCPTLRAAQEMAQLFNQAREAFGPIEIIFPKAAKATV